MHLTVAKDGLKATGLLFVWAFSSKKYPTLY